jgi:hypothetical protein
VNDADQPPTSLQERLRRRPALPDGAGLAPPGGLCFDPGRLRASPSKPDQDEIDSAWDDDDNLDSGWDDDVLDSGRDEGFAAGAEAGENSRRVPTPEEREARAARAAAKKDRRRAKATEKSDRRKSRAAAASAKQKKQEKKKSAPRPAAPVAENPRKARRPVARAEEEGSAAVPEASSNATPRARMTVGRRSGVPLVVVVLLGLVVAAGVIGLLLARR